MLLGGEREEGRRWPDFAASKGRLAGGALEESLPSVRGVRVLSWGREPALPVPPEAVRSVLAAARRRGGVVVVDLPRGATCRPPRPWPSSTSDCWSYPGS